MKSQTRPTELKMKKKNTPKKTLVSFSLACETIYNHIYIFVISFHKKYTRYTFLLFFSYSVCLHFKQVFGPRLISLFTVQ